MTANKRKRHQKGFVTELRKTHELILKWESALRGVLEKTERELNIYGTFLRAVCFFKSLQKLDEASDFQSIIHVHRALIEIAVDLIFQAHDKSDETALQIKAWERSAKLHAAEKIVDYYKQLNKPLPKQLTARKDFIKKNKQAIELERQRFWPSRKLTSHPSRWTNRILEQDIRKADMIEGSNLEEDFKEEYDRLNWFVHGAALAGSRDLNFEGFENLCCLSYTACSRLVLLCAKLTLRAFGYFKSGYFEEWQRRNEEILEAIAPYFL